MNTGLYSGVASGNASERRLESITANLANLDTPAYKRKSTGTKAFQLPGGREGDVSISTQTKTDFSQGDLEPSANPYHLALMGEGFFAVDGPDGELYTRNGQFHVNEDGVLLSAEGYPVAWEAKTDDIDPTGEMVTVDGAGEMRQGAKNIGRLKFVNFGDPAGLGEIGGGYYTGTRGNGEQISDAVVHQHNLERSNVSSVDELVGMITVQRSFENAKEVMQLIDQSYGRLTSQR